MVADFQSKTKQLHVLCMVLFDVQHM